MLIEEIYDIVIEMTDNVKEYNAVSLDLIDEIRFLYFALNYGLDYIWSKNVKEEDNE